MIHPLQEWIPGESGPLSVVIDTDAGNQIDDQFAITYAMLAKDRLNVQAIYAAPFSGRHGYRPEQGMQASRDEITEVLDALDIKDNRPTVLEGARSFLPDQRTPSPSAAAMDLVERSMSHDRENPLYIMAIGACTNIATALLMDSTLWSRIRIVWLAGQPLYWPNAREYNLTQDVAASRLLLASQAELLLLPCKHVVEQLRTTVHEIDQYIPPVNPIGRYLNGLFRTLTKGRYACSKPLWDIAATAALVLPGAVKYEQAPRPGLTADACWDKEVNGPPMRIATDIDRDMVYADFFKLISLTRMMDLETFEHPMKTKMHQIKREETKAKVLNRREARRRKREAKRVQPVIPDQSTNQSSRSSTR